MSYSNGILNFKSENTQIVVKGGGFNLTKKMEIMTLMIKI